ncbi:PHD domain-containing protein [Cephalotus follicularis]|uniref:PHD domain-containing protein n=1 Tax=Cephalotus follicularis TaxID=3775 RepID=A0A1Q3C4D6_CEPFO|nr:PHD domain-containing protein [Cephalotus follicularis]
MKGRSHRLQSSDPHEDWLDGSWTVDCVCGVNFDDGEEMVNCDDCGVWVHTRCSGYTKGDDLFTCDKCKSRNNDSEETEVAQLLVELPTKTVRMESSYNGPPPRRPFRLWTDIPMEERVHVQGIPGGDHSIFAGLSSVFTPELWKCTGYVPKKFNIRYREFPCWDEKKESGVNDEENENPVDKGAGVLFSLSKETVLPSPVTTLVGMRGRDKEDGYDRRVYSKEGKKWEGQDVDVRHSQDGVQKESGILRPVVVHSIKRKKEQLGTSKDQSGKKKSRAAEKEVDTTKRAGHTSKTVFTPTSDAKQLEFDEDRGLKTLMAGIQSVKNKNLKETVKREPVRDDYVAEKRSFEKPKTNLVAVERSSEALPSDISRNNIMDGAKPKEDRGGHQVSLAIKSSPKYYDDVVPASMLVRNDTRSTPVKDEAVDNLDDNVEGSSGSAVKPPEEDMTSAALEFKDDQIFQDFNGDRSQKSLQPKIEVNNELDNDNSSSILKSDIKDPGISGNHNPEIPEVNDAAVSSMHSSDHKAQCVERTSEALGDFHTDKATEFFGEPCQRKRELDRLGGSLPVPKSSLESKSGSSFAEELSKSSGSVLDSQAPSQCKMVLGVGKSFTTSSASDITKPAETQKSNANIKQRGVTDCDAGTQKNHAASDVRDEDRLDVSRKTVKEQPKSSLSFAPKASVQSRVSHFSVSRRATLDYKDSVISSSSKASSVQNNSNTACPGECVEAPQNQCLSHVQHKTSASGLPLRGEKFGQSQFHPSTKGNHAASMHPLVPSNSSATLSDEELALLLHQELNSSPRVPRVPRMRQAGNLPQLASPTATTMLIKRTSNSGGKDHGLVSRRKNKDASKDVFRSSREHDDEAKKTDKVPSSPDQRTHDMKREGDESSTVMHSVNRNISSAHMKAANSGPSSFAEAHDHNLSSVRSSPRNMSDDDIGCEPVHRTLPGLINEILGKGRRMTVEELCDAVLPHWHKLRKHNGERYAYSTHSQAVFDCLRNRHEWARLVDRGPKTNSSRKRRKFDTDESEDNEYGKGKFAKEIESRSIDSQREEFPKGKRKARKRRRLALQGRGIKDIRGRKAELLSDDDTGPFSGSSEESMFSQDEIHGGDPAKSEVSASSDEAGTS